MSLSEKIQDLNREIAASVERALTELRQEISHRLRASNDEIQQRLEAFTPSLPPSFLSHDDFAPHEHEVGSSARQGALRDLRNALADIDRARSQADILGAMLHASARYASRVAVLLVRGGELRGWGSEGFGDAEGAIRGLVLASPEGAWSRLAQAQGTLTLSASDCGVLCGRVESPLPAEGVLVPVVLRDRVAAGLYADRLDGGELTVEALQILAHAAAQAIETLPFRERASTPTLSLEGGIDGSGAPAAAPVPAAAEPVHHAEPEPAQPEAAPEAHAEAPTEAHIEAPSIEAHSAAAPEPAPAEPEPPAAAPAPERPPRTVAPTQGWAPSIPHVTEAMPLPGIPHLTAPPPPEPEPMAEEVPRYPRSVEPEPPAPTASPDATVLLQRSSFQDAAPAAQAPAPIRPVPAPEEPVAAAPSYERAAGTPEVRPPSDVDGPGWAFATTRMPVNPDNQSQHEEARRLARLLVSEIKLYNEEQVEEGRRNRDIYERLREDIDRSRQMYDERVDPQILRSTDYFYQELVRILAAGDSKALGI
ncbi:MAG TPA: hypothetical protein VIE43_10185 [Thermoanaerobaculia bacterium]|nr:hypothetical protein [Thermoanaerobaculia bacterium]